MSLMSRAIAGREGREDTYEVLRRQRTDTATNNANGSSPSRW